VTAPADTLRADASAWDAFVEAAPTGSYTQLTAWARVKRANGWRSVRLVVDGRSGPLGLQLLVRDLRPTPWRVGYAPRGPVGGDFDAAGVAALTESLWLAARRLRLVQVTIDPEVQADHPLVGHLDRAGWRPTASIQADRTRLLDLRRPEDQLWADLRSKCRQYVSKARRAGVTVEDAGAAGLDDFYRLYVETARRAGFVHRSQRAYEDVFRAYGATDRARLLLARLPDGKAAAALLLLTCGRRVIEPYGGMSEAGARSRANYLLKWEAIRSSRERGFEVYDMWGVAHAGIERFKSGFGGREVAFVGGRMLVVDRLGNAVTNLARRGLVGAARLRHGVRGGDGAGAAGGPTDADAT